MADPQIKFKRSSVALKRPSLDNVATGEFAINVYDGNLFTRVDTGGVGIATTVSNLTPWTENFGGESITYSGIQTSGGGVTTDFSSVTLSGLSPSSFNTTYARQTTGFVLDTGTVSSGNALFHADSNYYYYVASAGTNPNGRVLIYSEEDSSWVVFFDMSGNHSEGNVSENDTIGSGNVFNDTVTSNSTTADGRNVPTASGSIVYSTSGSGITTSRVGVVTITTSGDANFAGVITATGGVVVSNGGLNVTGDSTFTNDIHVTGSGKIGIGTNSPQQLLHLASTNPRIRLDDTDSSGYYTEIRQGGSATYLQLDGNNIGSGNFRITADGGNEILRINDKGNVSIAGSTSSFDINPTVTGLQFYFERDTQLATIASYDGTDGSEISIGTNDGTSDVAEAIRIKSDGKVGIGSNTPTSKLDIAGTTKTQQLNVSGVSTFSSHLKLDDDAKLIVGVGSDLQIYHDGSHSYISDEGQGNLKLRSNNFRFTNTAESKTSATFQPGAGVELFYNNTKRFETLDGGVKIVGTCTATAFVGDGSGLTNIVSTANTSHVVSDTIQVGVLTATSQFYPPSLTTAQRDAITFSTGAFIFNSTEERLQVYLGTTWASLTVDIDPYSIINM